MRGRLTGSLLAAALLALWVPAMNGGATAATSTVAATDTTLFDPFVIIEDTTTTSTSTSTTSTTTTTLPSAVTTVPLGCALPPAAQAVFVGSVKSIDPVAAVFNVSQVRAGSLDGYVAANSVEVRYGADVKFLDVGTTYIVGVALDPATQKLSSTIRDSAELFGGNEVVGGGVECPQFEAVARTLHTDGTAIESGVFSNFFGDPLRLLAALVLPAALLLVLLVAMVWLRRSSVR